MYRKWVLECSLREFVSYFLTQEIEVFPVTRRENAGWGAELPQLPRAKKHTSWASWVQKAQTVHPFTDSPPAVFVSGATSLGICRQSRAAKAEMASPALNTAKHLNTLDGNFSWSRTWPSPDPSPASTSTLWTTAARANLQNPSSHVARLSPLGCKDQLRELRGFRCLVFVIGTMLASPCHAHSAQVAKLPAPLGIPIMSRMANVIWRPSTITCLSQHALQCACHAIVVREDVACCSLFAAKLFSALVGQILH